MPALLILYQVLAYYASFAFFAAMSLSLNFCCFLAGARGTTDASERFFQRIVHRCFALFVWWLTVSRIVPVRYEGFDHWAPPRGRVIVANHPCLMDVGWLLARVPETMCIYKPAVGHNPLFGSIARCAGYLSSDRGTHLLRNATTKLAGGQNLLVFPEGTRTTGATLNALKPGFVAIARMARAPIQLVHITCDSELLTKARAWWHVPHLPAQIVVTLGPLLPPPGRDTDRAIAEISAWFRQASPGTRPGRAPQVTASVPART